MHLAPVPSDPPKHTKKPKNLHTPRPPHTRQVLVNRTCSTSDADRHAGAQKQALPSCFHSRLEKRVLLLLLLPPLAGRMPHTAQHQGQPAPFPATHHSSLGRPSLACQSQWVKQGSQCMG